MGLVNTIASFVTSSYSKRLENIRENPIQIQEKLLFGLIEKGKNTAFGKLYNLSNHQQFQQLPVVTYEEFQPLIERARKGEENVIWPGKITWFAKSSGTTNAKSKFIPITKESLEEGHFAAGKMMFAAYFDKHPETGIFKRKNLRLGGSAEIYQEFETKFGDLSAIMIENLPIWTDFMNTPNRKISLMSEWNQKLQAISDTVIKENVGCMTGVPSWMLVLLNHILTQTGKENLHQIWPELEVFFHGGISFKPYKANYDVIAGKPLNYFEIYNASEGFFALQDAKVEDGLLLLLDNGIYYEFIPMKDFGTDNQKVIPLSDVEENVNYAVILTTNGGLWRYILGDTVRFVSTHPYRIIVTGRTKHYINAFGEELIIENAEEALKFTAEKTQSTINEYTAAPIYMQGKNSGAHEWIIEFDQKPQSLAEFTEIFDKKLQNLNSDYEAKRYNNMTLNPPKIHVARENLFFDWMEKRGKLGGQNKVPRLCNTREYIEPLLELNKT